MSRAAELLRKFMDLAILPSAQNPPFLDAVLLTEDGEHVKVLSEGLWVSGRFERNIRIDQPTHGVGQMHAHIYGRRGEEIGVINLDGTASHGTKMRLHDKDAAILRDRGFDLPADNIIEWIVLSGAPRLILS